MKTSGLFTTHQFTIPIRYGQPVRIIFFGDIHRDSPNHADGKWQDFLDYCRGLKDAYYFGIGDYLDSTSTTERECLGLISKKMHDTFRNDVRELQTAKIDLIAKELSFMKGRLIGLLNGNHYFDFPDGTNTDQKLAERLKTHYLGVCTLARITFKHESGSRHHAIDIFAHHGMGASRLIGGSLNRVAQMVEGVVADWYVMGHDHKRGAVPSTPRLHLENNSVGGLKLRERETWVIRSGSYLASYRPGEVNYNVDSARMPASLGHIEMIVTLHQKSNTGRRTTEIEVHSVT